MEFKEFIQRGLGWQALRKTSGGAAATGIQRAYVWISRERMPDVS